MKIKLVHDSRDANYKSSFGQVVTLPIEYNVDSTLFDEIQPIGDVKCTCYTITDIAEDQEKREFDIDDLWFRIPHDQDGADPRSVLKEAVANGLLPKGQKDRVKDWKSYWSCKSGIKDVFDNVRSGIYVSQSPVGVALFWCEEWIDLPAWGIMPFGKTELNGHMFSVEGWKIVDNKPYLIVEAWIGRKLLMSREVFNDAMSKYGTQAWVLSTAEIDSRREKTLLETIKDICINIIILLKDILIRKGQTPVFDSLKTEEPITNPYNEVKEAITYLWDTKENVRHSIRVICDEEGLTVEQKNTLCATIGAESNFNPKAVNIKTKDYGLCQINEYYWIGKGKPFPSIDFVLNNPEKCVRWMCKQWKYGHRDWWIAYKNGLYKKFL